MDSGVKPLSATEQATILAALRNGLGLTNACLGLQLEPKQVSAYIRQDKTFESNCRQQLIIGFQTLVLAMNDASHKKIWDRWRATKDNLNVTIKDLNLWEGLFTPADWSFENFTIAIRSCKTIEEAATAMGFTIQEIWQKIYQDHNLLKWLIQNGYSI